MAAMVACEFFCFYIKIKCSYFCSQIGYAFEMGDSNLTSSKHVSEYLNDVHLYPIFCPRCCWDLSACVVSTTDKLETMYGRWRVF